jgi:hypothetical protein
VPITPSLLGPAQAELSMAPIAAPERPPTPRIPRINELTRNEIYAAQRKARDDSRPDKRGKTVMQRLASGLGRPHGPNKQSRFAFPRLMTTSALPPKADIGTQLRNVRFVPKADRCGEARLQ